MKPSSKLVANIVRDVLSQFGVKVTIIYSELGKNKAKRNIVFATSERIPEVDIHGVPVDGLIYEKLVASGFDVTHVKFVEIFSLKVWDKSTLVIRVLYKV